MSRKSTETPDPPNTHILLKVLLDLLLNVLLKFCVLSIQNVIISNMLLLYES